MTMNTTKISKSKKTAKPFKLSKTIKTAASIILSLAMICSSVPVQPTISSAAVKAKKITLNKTKLNLSVGETAKIKVKKVTPKGAGKAVKYTSASKKIAKVNKKGVVTAISEGKTKITVTSKSNKKIKKVVKVTVRDNAAQQSKSQTQQQQSQSQTQPFTPVNPPVNNNNGTGGNPPMRTMSPIIPDTPANPGPEQPTKEPIGPDNPEVTDEPTQPTEEPVITDEPGQPTEEPVITEEPVVTKEPEQTKKPEATKRPKPTATPPQVTDAPTPTPAYMQEGAFVYDKLDISWIDPEKPMVAFTFDDGPVGTADASFSMRIQKALKEYNFHATFNYVTSKLGADAMNNEVLMAMKAGHEIANHTSQWSSLTEFADGEAVAAEIEKARKTLSDLTGISDFTLRPPNLAINVMVQDNCNVPLIGCSVISNDWESNVTKEHIVEVVKGAKDGDIVLLHETMDHTAQAVEELVPWFAKQGYQIVSVAELFAAKNIPLFAGNYYNKAEYMRPHGNNPQSTQTPKPTPTPTPTAMPPQVTDAPTPTPTNAPYEKDLDISSVNPINPTNQDDWFTYDAATKTLTAKNLEGILVPIGEDVEPGETVEITIYGSARNASGETSIRAWLSDVQNPFDTNYSDIQNPAEWERTYSYTATDVASGIQIKKVAYNAENFTELIITRITVKKSWRDPNPEITEGPTKPDVTKAPTSPDVTKAPVSPVTTQSPMNWVSTWGTAEENFNASPDLMPQPLNGTTVRQIIKVTTSGDEFKLRLSNQYGKSDVTIHSLHIAKQGPEANKSTIDTATDTIVTVGGKEEFVIPAGKVIETDGVKFSINALENVAISAYFGDTPTTAATMTGHRGARATTYQVNGNMVSEKTFEAPITTTAWYFLADASVMSPEGSKAVVCFGDSITDGYGTDASYLGKRPDSYTRWGDYFARRLQANEKTKNISVINEGIGSNSMMGSYPTDAGKDRFARDLLEHDGVGYCIILFGVNDLDKLQNTGKFNQLLPEYQKMVALCHENGIKVYGAPILPFGTSSYYSEASEQVRNMINDWMRSPESNMDGIIDFDKAVADPANPKNILEKYTHSDGLHPYDGYDVMADAIDLTLFTE